MQHGFHDILLAYPIVTIAKMHRLLTAAMAAGTIKLCCLVDCQAHVAIAAAAATTCGVDLELMIKVGRKSSGLMSERTV